MLVAARSKLCSSVSAWSGVTWTLTKRLEKKLDGNYTRMLRAILNKSWRQHPTRHQRYGYLPPITKTIQVKRTRHAGHYWRSRDELIRDVLLWTPTHGRAKAGRPARTYIQQLCEDTDAVLKTYLGRWTMGGVAKEGQGYPCYQRDMMMMMYICVCVYICIYMLAKLAFVVAVDPKAPFSIATTERCRGGATP